MRRFITKKIQERRTKFRNKPIVVKEFNELQNEEININIENNIKEEKKIDVMDTKEKIELANQILEQEVKVKRIKKDKGLIEKVETNKIILTEDNRELLRD